MTRALTFTRTVTTAADLDVSRITDLTIGSNGALYATTNYDGWVSAWDISADALIQIDDALHTSPLVAGATPGLSLITRNGAPALLSGGHNGGSMSLRPLAGDGSFAGFINLGTATRFAGPFLHPVSLDLSGGTQAVYGGIVGGNGIAQLGFDGDGILTGTSIIASDAITAITSGTVNGVQYLFTASASDINLRTWAVASDGALTLKTTMIAEDGLWVSAPTALATTVIAGTTYLVLASAGSSSLTVLQVGSTGTLGVVDHLLDDRHSRFAGASVIETVTHDGLTYVITGGSDDGISVYAVLPGGRLVPRAHIADTDGMSLANISSIAAQARGSGLDLFVASASEPGLTRLRYEAGNAQVITGTPNAEALSGASGDDIIFDGGGSDTLTGHAGADLFILDRDGVSDTISDFELGVDTLDLSGWTGLRSLNQLFFDTTATGITITYGDETLFVHSHDGAAITPSDLSDTDLLSGARIPQVIAPGYPGPVTDPPPGPFMGRRRR